MADEERKGATAQAATTTMTMIDTTGTPAAKKTPLLKLGRKRLGMARNALDGDQDQDSRLA